jgi:hypothetical protein
VTNNELEFMKLIFAFFQQLTTLNLAAAAIVPVVAKALDLSFPISVAAMGCFTASVIGSGGGMYITASRINNGDNSAPIGWLIFACCFIVAGVFFFSSMSVWKRWRHA